MNEKPKGRTLSKQRLDITNIEMDVPYSQGTKQLDRVQAVNLSLAEDSPLAGKPLRMTIFNAELKTFIRGKTTIVADIEETDRPDSRYGPDRTIVQVYDDKGQPVSKPSAKGGFQGRSPESIRLEYFFKAQIENQERISIEGQTAIAQVGNVITGDKTPFFLPKEEFERIGRKYWQAVEKALDAYLAAKPLEIKAVTPIAAGPGNAPGKTQEAKGGADKPPPDSPAAWRPDKTRRRPFDQGGEAEAVGHAGRPYGRP